MGLALLTLVPFFNFHALKFNVNTVLMPVWAATTLWFLRSFETRRPLDAALAGARRRRRHVRQILVGLPAARDSASRRSRIPGARPISARPAPWITIAVGALALAPHVALADPQRFRAVLLRGCRARGGVAGRPPWAACWVIVAGSVAYIAVAAADPALVAARPSAARRQGHGVAEAPERRLAAAPFWAVLLVPALVAPFASVRLVSLWSMSAWTLLPVMLLSSPLITISRRDAAGIVTLAVVFPFVMIALAPAVAFAIHRAGPAALHRALRDAGGTGRAAVARNLRPAVAGVRRLRGFG